MCLTGDSSSTHAAQILQLPRGPKEDASPSRQTNHPFSDTHLSYRPHLPLSVPTDGWPCGQPGSAAQREPPALRPSVRSRSVNQGLFIAGTLPCPGSQPRLAPSVPGLWRRNRTAKVGSHWPGAPPRPCRPDLRPETDPSLLESGDDGRGMVLLNSSSVWEWADTREEWTPFSTIIEIPYGILIDEYLQKLIHKIHLAYI